MVEKAWIVRQGDALVVHTSYVKCVHKATDMTTSTQRGGAFFTAEEITIDYMRALKAAGYVCDFTIPEKK